MRKQAVLQKTIRLCVWIGCLIGIIIAIQYIDNKLSTTAAQDPNAVQVVAIGDSLTYGSGDPKSVGYIGRVKEHLSLAWNKEVSVQRYAVRGYRTDQIMVHIQNAKAQQSIRTADYVFLFVGTNDFIQAARRDFQTINPLEMERKRKQFENNLYQLIGQIRRDNRHSPLILLGMYDPYGSLLNHDQISGILKKWNNTTFTMTKEYPNTIFIPTNKVYLHKNKEEYFSDYIHPNPKGYELLSNRVIDGMREQGLLLEN
ncbi:GDSL-type esterase/lipase family protein [Alkalihalobacillus sp. AL-G]|uniref:GDSL-type esterase/lipase family protein n=1 Tax=Alkalihalobacillus sp. AL-G TaxID=2926399 RepID=UPI00272B1682|nr:GDSL-type esterase/lipase family protein [Alkalihalobacillus sp. AL-G]WLD92471.1 GDSL-type esterase/lipase family protein [Alkalihalobacillus sp. AL-G]